LRQLNAVLNKFVRDRQPAEAAEAARRQENAPADSVAGSTQQISVNPKLAVVFRRDASKSLAVLEALYAKQDAYSDEDMRMYVVSVHGMKSALANIGELKLSALAAELEQAGRERKLAVMASETPVFLNALREVIEAIPAKNEVAESGGTTDGDWTYLCEKLRALKAACGAYDKKAAKNVLAEVQQKAWPNTTGKLLDAIAEHLLHSKFKVAVSVADEIIASHCNAESKQL